MGWFGSMQLAYRYFLVFGIALAATIAAGFAKVWYDRRKLKKFTKSDHEAVAVREDQVELNAREKDEGDLFGVRALEAGYFAGIAQSRPSSAAGSYVGTPSMSSNTLIGSMASPKINTHSPESSVTSLPLAHTNGGRSSADPTQSLLSQGNSPPRRKSPPTIKLRPSEAEINGRINHSASVNMNLAVPPSPVLARGPQSPQMFAGSDDESDGHLTPRSLSPHSPTFPSDRSKPSHYAPVPPQIPMPEGLSLSVRPVSTPENPAGGAKSQAASFDDRSPNASTPPSPGPPPEIQVPSIPSQRSRDEPRSLFPAYFDSQHSADSTPKDNKPAELPAPLELQPKTYQPSHQRDVSEGSSMYSQENRKSFFHGRTDSSDSLNFSHPNRASRQSVNLSTGSQSRRPSGASGNSLAPTDATNDPRFSEFYDSYFRQSQYGTAQKADVQKRPAQQIMTQQPTIVEVPSPLPSPMPREDAQLGMAL